MNSSEEQGPIRVLAVDDNNVDLVILEHHLNRLKNLQLETITATCPAEALRIAQEQELDLIFVDYDLRTMSGIDLFSEFQLVASDVPVILITGTGDEEVAVAAMHAGFADYLSKDVVSPRGLQRAIVNAIEKFTLRRSLARKSEDLERTVQALSDRNREVLSFYHSLSHELKTPLTAIREFVSIVLDGLQGPLGNDQRDSLETAKLSCDQMVRYIDDILDVTRLETGKMSIKPARTDLCETLRNAVAICAPTAEAKGVELSTDIEESVCDAWCDEPRVLQVLANLLGNALKFTDEGGRVEVSATAAETAGRIRVAVRDTGCGIPEEDQKHIFERLYQSNEEQDCALRGGLGLGLTLCRELVGLHGGEITVESELGRGSVFTFDLPTFDPARNHTNETPGKVETA